MIKYSLMFLLFLLAYAYGYSQESNGDTLRYKATLKPLKSNESTVTEKVKSNDASCLTFSISNDTITAKLYNRSARLRDSNSIEKFLLDNKTTINKSKVEIVNEQNGSVEKFKELVEVLRKNDITKFNLVSH